MKISPMAILVVPNSLNGLDHDYGSHMDGKQQKSRLGSMYVKTMYKNNR